MSDIALTKEAMGEPVPWYVAPSCAYGCAVGSATSTTLPYVFSLLIEPVSREFGWGRAMFSSGLITTTLAAGIAIPLAGRAMDRWGVRAVLAPGLVVLALVTALMSKLNGSPVQLHALFALLGGLGAFGTFIAYGKVISAWYRQRRGLMLGLTMGAGVGVGGLAAPWLTGYLLDHYGWRGTYTHLGIILLLLAVPNSFLLKEPPKASHAEHRVTSSALGPEGIPSGAALKTATFWLLFGIVVLSTIATSGALVQLAPMISARGIDSGVAKIALSALAITSTLGRIATGHALDRFQTPRIAIPLFAMVFVGLATIAFGPPTAIVAGTACIGFGLGAESDVIPYYVARYFGLRSFGEIFGYLYACVGLAFGIGPLIVGILFDTSGTYTAALIALLVAISASMLLVGLLYPYRFALRREVGLQ